MIEYLALAKTVANITSKVISLGDVEREQVAIDLDNIAKCTREIAALLQGDDPDIMELTGRLD
jgi:hypothetical protein